LIFAGIVLGLRRVEFFGVMGGEMQCDVM
jgi:hypothetical protein